MKVDVSAIIATKNRHEALRHLLWSISRLEDVPKEIVIVDGSRVAVDTECLALPFEKRNDKPVVVYLHVPTSTGLTHKRNVGVRVAQGRLYQFLDDDVELTSDYFARILPLFDDVSVGGASCLITEKRKSNPLLKAVFYRVFFLGRFRQQREEVGLHTKKSIIATNILPGTAIYRRQVCEKFAFDENLKGPCLGEDVEFSFRVSSSWKLLIHCGVSIVHHRSDAERSSLEKTIEAKIAFYHYHFSKNVPKSPLNNILFAWMLFGVLLSALAHSNAEARRGLFSGLRALLNSAPTVMKA